MPDFDPNDRPRPLTEGDASDSPLFHRAVQGVYELGSTFKVFASAQALALGLVNPNTLIDTSPPMRVNGHPGLFVIGELLDVDGPIGGLSFQAAFSTAELAGRALAE